MSWAEHHTTSSRLAEAAEAALKAGETQQALELYSQACDYELRALKDLDPDRSRTLGVTVTSAFWLLRKAGRTAEAEEFASRWLQDPTLPALAKSEMTLPS